MSIHILVTRKLNKKSPFHKLKKHGFTITGRSLWKIKPLKFDSPPFHSGVFFYSARAIAIYLKQQGHKKNLMYGVMGKASNKVFKKITGRDADLIYRGDLEALATDMDLRWNGYSVVFPMAKNSLHSLQGKLKTITQIPLTIYDNKISKKVKIPKATVLIFTSPLNVQAYLNQKKIKKNQIVLAIGSTTAQAIQAITGEPVPYPEQPSEKAVIKLLKEIFA